LIGIYLVKEILIIKFVKILKILIGKMRCGVCGIEGHRKGSKECKGKIDEPIDVPIINTPEKPEEEQSRESKRWTEEQYEKLKSLVLVYGLEINWEEISKEMNRTPEACRLKYNEIVNSKERLGININKLNDNEIESMISECRKVCNNEECNYVYYSEAYKWKEKELCEKCYRKTYEERNELWKNVREYMETKGGYYCRFCGMKDSEYSCHFDHINMFNKMDSICVMVNRGDTIKDIIEEVDRCQLICKSCHSIVTMVEKKLGFHSVKANITKKENNGEIIEEKEKEDLQEIYSRNIDRIYEYIRIKKV